MMINIRMLQKLTRGSITLATEIKQLPEVRFKFVFKDTVRQGQEHWLEHSWLSS